MKTVILPFCLMLIFGLCCAEAADVVVVGDVQLKPVADVVSGMKKTLQASMKIYAPAETKGVLAKVVEKERARVVVALGRDALADALLLPRHVPVVYGLVVVPPASDRPNTTGHYLATPVREYAELLRKSFPYLTKVAVIGTDRYLDVLHTGDSRYVAVRVANSVEFVSRMQETRADAVVLLPDAAILTATAMQEALLYSFRKRIPLLGVSERNVKEGALLALVAETVHVGRMIGETAAKALRGVDIGAIPPASAGKFDLYLNVETARKMDIEVPDEIFRKVKRTYP